MTVLAIFLPMAWQLLVLRATERYNPKAPAESVLPELELTVLRRHVSKKLMPPKATARHVIRAIAKLGGHLSGNGAPGWLVIGRGLEHLLTLSDGWRAAIE